MLPALEIIQILSEPLYKVMRKKLANVNIRLAQDQDKKEVLIFCQETWEYSSDFVPLVWDKWLADPQTLIFVAEMDGSPVAILGAVIISEREAWWQGFRVAPACRLKGLGFALSVTLDSHLEQYLLEANIKVLRYSTDSNTTFIDRYSKWQGRQKVGLYIPYKANAIDYPLQQMMQLDAADFDSAWALVTNSNSLTQESLLYLNQPTKWQELTSEQLNKLLNERRVWGLKRSKELSALAIQMPVNTVDYLEGANDVLWKGAHQTLWIGYINGTEAGLKIILNELRSLAHSEGYLAVGGMFPIKDHIIDSLDLAGYQCAEELEYWVYEWHIQT